jgi:AcrR family transcriptional regulator
MRQKILEKSIHLFDQKGFTGTSIQEIVELIGVTKGTFYYYYKNKEELLKDIHLRYIEHLNDQQESILQDPVKSYTEKLYEIVYMVIRNIRTQRPIARIFFREMRHLSERNLEEIHSKRNVFRENYQKMIEAGISKGEFNTTIPPDILTFGILGMTNWSYYWYNPDGEISEEELTKTYVDILLHGISSVSSVELLKK